MYGSRVSCLIYNRSFNTSKCEVIRITKRNPIQTPYMYNIHCQDLTFARINPGMPMQSPQQRRSTSPEPSTEETGQDANRISRHQILVRPILEYASTAWDLYIAAYISQIESALRKICHRRLQDETNISQIIMTLAGRHCMKRDTRDGAHKWPWVNRHPFIILPTSIPLPTLLSLGHQTVIQPFRVHRHSRNPIQHSGECCFRHGRARASLIML